MNHNYDFARKKTMVYDLAARATLNLSTPTSFTYLVTSLIESASFSKEEKSENFRPRNSSRVPVVARRKEEDNHILGFRDLEKGDMTPNTTLPLVVIATAVNH